MSLDIFGNLTTSSNRITIQENKDYIHPVEELETAAVEDADEKIKRPIVPLVLLMILGLVPILVQLARLQVLSFPYYRGLASGNSVRIETIPAPRGLIVDKNNKPLAKNIYDYTVVVNLSELPIEQKERDILYRRLTKLIDLNQSEIEKLESLRLKSGGEIVLRTKLDRDQMLLLKEKLAKEKAFSVSKETVRFYDSSISLSHLLGYMGLANDNEVAKGQYLANDVVGRMGLEKVYDRELRGLPGQKFVEVDAAGKLVRVLPAEKNYRPTSGYNLKLHLDLDLQQKTVEFLQTAINERDKKFGQEPKLGASAIVLNPKTGAILSLVSLPSFDNNLFATGITEQDYQSLQQDPSLPMINRTIQAQLPSGSAIKPVIAASALSEGTISPQFAIDTPSAIQIGEFTFPDWKDHGRTDIRRAIAESNNIFFYGLGGGWENQIKGLGMEKLGYYFNQFGFGSISGLDLTGESSGFVPSPAWKLEKRKERWYIGDTYHFSIGQGDFLTTPLQLANATAAIANGGALYEPRLADAFVDNKDQVKKTIQPKLKNQNFISASSAQIVREGMRQGVEYGSSHVLNNLKVHIAGKTGTAQYGNQDRTHAWFTSFAPYEDPQIVVLVVVEGGGDGHLSALPVAEKIYRHYFNEPAPAPPAPEVTPVPETPPSPEEPITVPETPPANPESTVPIEGG